MSVIEDCAVSYLKLMQYEYRFVVSRNRKTKEILLDFRDTDFFHLVGLQHIVDISIPQNRKDVLSNILEKRFITDEMIQKSRFYLNSTPHLNVKSRMEEARYIENYLDVNNYIYIYSLDGRPHMQSYINAEYVIQSKLKNSLKTVYIFLKRRKEDEQYFGITSFFPQTIVSYGGYALYWMLKEKKHKKTGSIQILFKHKNFEEVSDKSE